MSERISPSVKGQCSTYIIEFQNYLSVDDTFASFISLESLRVTQCIQQTLYYRVIPLCIYLEDVFDYFLFVWFATEFPWVAPASRELVMQIIPGWHQRDLPACASQGLGLMVCTTTPNMLENFGSSYGYFKTNGAHTIVTVFKIDSSLYIRNYDKTGHVQDTK